MKTIHRATGVCLTAMLGLAVILVGCAQPVSAPKPASSPPPAAAKSPAAKAAFKWPEPLVVASKDPDSATYANTAGAADVLRRVKGITMRVVPSGTDVAKATLLTGGRAHFVNWSGSGAHIAQEGVYEFADIELGPWPVRTLAAGLSNQSMYATTAADANIKTWADAKGKRVGWIPGAPASNLSIEYLLAFGGVTMNDVKKVNASSVGAGGRMVIEGQADIAIGSPNTTWVAQLAASPRGVFWPQVPATDEAGWARMRALSPVLYKVTVTEGAGVKGPLQLATYPNSMWNLLDSADAELAYQFTRTMAELRNELLATRILGIETYDVKNFVFDFPVPYHDGAVRYFKEAGIWTAEAQKNNDGLIKRQQVLKAAWDKALAEAIDKKTPPKDFRKLWEGIRIKALEAAGLPVYYKT